MTQSSSFSWSQSWFRAPLGWIRHFWESHPMLDWRRDYHSLRGHPLPKKTLKGYFKILGFVANIIKSGTKNKDFQFLAFLKAPRSAAQALRPHSRGAAAPCRWELWFPLCESLLQLQRCCFILCITEYMGIWIHLYTNYPQPAVYGVLAWVWSGRKEHNLRLASLNVIFPPHVENCTPNHFSSN